MTQDEARAAVARGAALLDKKKPGWAMRIDIDTLDIACTSCVLFQLGGYTEVADELGILSNADRYGFFVPSEESGTLSNPSWQLLQDAWIEAIGAMSTRESRSLAL